MVVPKNENTKNPFSWCPRGYLGTPPPVSQPGRAPLARSHARALACSAGLGPQCAAAGGGLFLSFQAAAGTLDAAAAVNLRAPPILLPREHTASRPTHTRGTHNGSLTPPRRRHAHDPRPPPRRGARPPTPSSPRRRARTPKTDAARSADRRAKECSNGAQATCPITCGICTRPLTPLSTVEGRDCSRDNRCGLCQSDCDSGA